MKLQIASRTLPDWDSLSKVIDHSVLDKGERSLRAYNSVFNDLGAKSWKHIHYSFYFEIEPMMLISITANSNLDVSCYQCDDAWLQAGFVSGNLHSWNQAFIEFCNSNHDIKVRAFFNTVMNIIENDGIRFQSSRRELADRTFILE